MWTIIFILFYFTLLSTIICYIYFILTHFILFYLSDEASSDGPHSECKTHWHHTDTTHTHTTHTRLNRHHTHRHHTLRQTPHADTTYTHHTAHTHSTQHTHTAHRHICRLNIHISCTSTSTSLRIPPFCVLITHLSSSFIPFLRFTRFFLLLLFFFLLFLLLFFF